MSQTNNQSTVETKVSTDEIDLDQYFGTPGADAAILPAEEKKTNIFQKEVLDLSYLEEGEPQEGNTPIAPAGPSVLAELDEELFQEEEAIAEENKKGGRPKTEKSALVNLLKKKIESGAMFAFDDYDETQPLEEYLGKLTEKETEDLWDANINHIKRETEETFPEQFMESLPDKMQFALKYIQQGGQDLEGLFSALAQSEQVAGLSPEADAETIAERYLYETKFGTDEEIAEVIEEWKNAGTLEKKTANFKKKLDEIENRRLETTLAEQTARRKQQEEAANSYVQNVFEALKPGEVNGLKMSRQTQETLYKGLIKPEYQSVNGKPTNLLGHLLEKYQFGSETNYPLIAEALWLLSDPDSYRNELRKEGGNEKAETIAKKLKTEQQAGKVGSTRFDNQETSQRKSSTKKLERPTGFFKR